MSVLLIGFNFNFLISIFFQALVICVRFFHRLKFFYYNPPPIPVETIKTNPYGVKNFRKLIDSCTFKMYGHWVKKGDNQNRAALFEHVQREDWRNQVSFDNSWWHVPTLDTCAFSEILCVHHVIKILCCWDGKTWFQVACSDERSLNLQCA